MSIREEARRRATEIYMSRLTALNVGAETKTVLDSIDRPMRPLILELHRIGCETTFCCCGFSYEGEEEPKSHHATFTYVFIKNAVRSELAKDNMSYFLSTLVNGGFGWKNAPFRTPTNEQLVHLYFVNPLPNLYQTQDGIPAIHNYESQALAIKRATEFATRIPTAVKEIRIRDGNADYFDAGFDEWQVEPRTDYVSNIMTNVAVVDEQVLEPKE